MVPEAVKGKRQARAGKGSSGHAETIARASSGEARPGPDPCTAAIQQLSDAAPHFLQRRCLDDGCDMDAQHTAQPAIAGCHDRGSFAGCEAAGVLVLCRRNSVAGVVFHQI